MSKSRIVYINPPFGEDFVRSARWAATPRGRVQRHPEQALIHLAVLEQRGHECLFIEGAARNLPESLIISKTVDFNPDFAVIHTTTPSIYNDINYAVMVKEKLPSCKVIMAGHMSAPNRITLSG